MSPTPQENAWTFEVKVKDTGYGDYHYDGAYLEEILRLVKQFLTEEFNGFSSLDAFCWCEGCRTVYVGAFIKRYSSLECSSILFTIGGRCYYGHSHTEDPDSRLLALHLTQHIKASLMEQGFAAEVECVPVTNAFQSV